MESENYGGKGGSSKLNRDQMGTNVHRKKSLKRKEAARRSLIDSIYTKHGDLKYSFPCVSYEKINSEIKFPRVNSTERSVRRVDYAVTNSNRRSKNDSSKTSSPNPSLEIPDESGRSDHLSRNGHTGNYRNSSSQNVSLPEIIMEFNIETNYSGVGTRMVSPATEMNGDERALGAPYEEYLKRMRYNKFNPCRSRHRPVTPGLLESLSKLRVPSKVKTEQWLKSTQMIQKPFHSHVYKTENLDNTNSTNWIYTD